MEKFEKHQHSRNNFFDSLRQRGHSLGVKYELQWTLRHYDLVIGRVSTCRLQNGQGQAGILSGLARATKVARGTKALL
jgi:hypothetical protein